MFTTIYTVQLILESTNQPYIPNTAWFYTTREAAETYKEYMVAAGWKAEVIERTLANL